MSKPSKKKAVKNTEETAKSTAKAMSTHDIITRSGNINVLQGQFISVNTFGTHYNS